jgi:hypothetical protein
MIRLCNADWWELCQQRMKDSLNLAHVEQQEPAALASLSVNYSTVMTLCCGENAHAPWRIDSACAETKWAMAELAPLYFIVSVHEAIEHIQALAATWWLQSGHHSEPPDSNYICGELPKGFDSSKAQYRPFINGPVRYDRY